MLVGRQLLINDRPAYTEMDINGNQATLVLLSPCNQQHVALAAAHCWGNKVLPGADCGYEGWTEGQNWHAELCCNQQQLGPFSTT